MIDDDVFFARAALTWPGGSAGNVDDVVDGTEVDVVRTGEVLAVAVVVAGAVAPVLAAEILPADVLVARVFAPEPQAETASAATVTAVRTMDRGTRNLR